MESYQPFAPGPPMQMHLFEFKSETKARKKRQTGAGCKKKRVKKSINTDKNAYALRNSKFKKKNG